MEARNPARRRATLRPFPAEGEETEACISTAVERRGGQLALRFRLQGTAGLEIPERAPQPERRDELWRATCLEVFLARSGAPGYWEVNLSPAGHWNVYRFTGYRQGMAQEEGIRGLPHVITHKRERLTVEAVLDLTALRLDEGEVDVGLSAVLRSTGGEVFYHALAHPRAGEEGGGQPDFHHRAGFRLRLS